MGKTLGIPSRSDAAGGVTVSQPLRILALVTDAFGGHGGIAEYNRQLLLALAGGSRHCLTVILPRHGNWSGPLPENLQQLPSRTHKVRYSLAALRLASQRKFDVVFCGHPVMAPLAAVVARLARAKLWVQVHGIDAWRPLSEQHQRALAQSSLITSVSRYTRHRLLRWAALPGHRVKVLPNVSSARFETGPKPQDLAEKYGCAGKKVLLTVSRLAKAEQYKGQDRVIEVLPDVLARYPGLVYLIVGDGDDRPRLEALAGKVGVRNHVNFVGTVASDQLPAYFRLADLFVMPSTGEGFGIVFLEAMASGLRVIAGEVDGSVDPLADGQLGQLVDPNNPAQLADAISHALAMPPPDPKQGERFNSLAFAEYLDGLLATFFGQTDGTSTERDWSVNGTA